MFIGRQAELNFLEERYNGASAQFIVLYGRRRLGKTELLRQIHAPKFQMISSLLPSVREF